MKITKNPARNNRIRCDRDLIIKLSDEMMHCEEDSARAYSIDCLEKLLIQTRNNDKISLKSKIRESMRYSERKLIQYRTKAWFGGWFSDGRYQVFF